MNSSPSSSESRLIRVLPVMKPGCRAFAPSSPVSSATVNSASILPVLSPEVRTASWAAMPIPQSAPSVVSGATIQPSLISYFMGSLLKSWSTPAFFSQTMSEWLCNTIVGTFSFPSDASFTITALPAASVWHSRAWAAANDCSHATIFSSCPDSRGIFVISLKMDRTSSDVILYVLFSDCRRQVICGPAQAFSLCQSHTVGKSCRKP